MAYLTHSLIILIALLHLYFLILEMFLWEKPIGLRTFGMKPEFAHTTKTLAANQGLYNGFLSAGLIWGVCLGNNGTPIKLFFLACVALAGIYGGITVNRRILFIQGMPAIVAILLLSTSLM